MSFHNKTENNVLELFSHDMLYLTAFPRFRSRLNAQCILAMVMIIVLETSNREFTVLDGL